MRWGQFVEISAMGNGNNNGVLVLNLNITVNPAGIQLGYLHQIGPEEHGRLLDHPRNPSPILEINAALGRRDRHRVRMILSTQSIRGYRQALSYTNERYLAGASTLFEVTLARADLVSAESGEVSARYRLLWQSHLVEYYIGTLDTDG